MHKRLNEHIQQFVPGAFMSSLSPFFDIVNDQYCLLEDTQKKLRLWEQLDSAVLPAMIIMSLDGRVLQVNKPFLQLWQLCDSDILGSDSDAVYRNIAFHMLNNDQFMLQAQHILTAATSVDESYELLDGRIIECLGYLEKDVGVVWSFKDKTSAHRQQQLISHQMHHDDLTTLPNNVLLNDRICHAMAKAARKKSKLALLHLDVDGFHVINETLGQDAGDFLLLDIARRLQSLTRAEDTVARIGSDEFVVLLEETRGQQSVLSITERLLETARQAVRYKNNDMYAPMSIGIALYPEDGDNAETLLKHAYIALYQAKLEGKNRLRFFTASLQRIARHRKSMESLLRQAVKEQAFELYYQPVFDLHSGELQVLEAFMRWHDGHTFMSPETFIPIAETCGLMKEISEWVLDQLCRQAVKWRRAGYSDCRVAMNISCKQFHQSDIFELVYAALVKHKLSANAIAIEVTAALFIDDDTDTVAVLRQLQNIGVTVIMDNVDPYSTSLIKLKDLPIDMLKIDKALIKNIEQRTKQGAIAAAIIADGKALGLTVLAIGVESDEQLQVLQQLGCDMAQGFYFSAPLPADDISLTKPHYFRQHRAHRPGHEQQHR